MAETPEERVARLEERANGNDSLHEKLNGNLESIWKAIDEGNKVTASNFKETQKEISRRLPLWATFTLGAMAATISGLVVAFLKG